MSNNKQRLEEAISLLSGDLNYDNIAEARNLLKQLDIQPNLNLTPGQARALEKFPQVVNKLGTPEADRAIMETMESYHIDKDSFLFVTVGSDDLPATEQDVADTRKLFGELLKDRFPTTPIVVTHHNTCVNVIRTPIAEPQDIPKSEMSTAKMRSLGPDYAQIVEKIKNHTASYQMVEDFFPYCDSMIEYSVRKAFVDYDPNTICLKDGSYKDQVVEFDFYVLESWVAGTTRQDYFAGFWNRIDPTMDGIDEYVLFSVYGEPGKNWIGSQILVNGGRLPINPRPYARFCGMPIRTRSN